MKVNVSQFRWYSAIFLFIFLNLQLRRMMDITSFWSKNANWVKTLVFQQINFIQYASPRSLFSLFFMLMVTIVFYFIIAQAIEASVVNWKCVWTFVVYFIALVLFPIKNPISLKSNTLVVSTGVPEPAVWEWLNDLLWI